MQRVGLKHAAASNEANHGRASSTPHFAYSTPSASPPTSHSPVGAAGALAGGISGAITTPFDVLKTRAQLATDRAHPLLTGLRSIAAEEGLGALFRGWSARSAKAAPACAIVLSSYEMIKHLY